MPARVTTIRLEADQASTVLQQAIDHIENPTSPLPGRLALVGAEQLPLPGIAEEVEGVRMRQVRDYFARVLVLEKAMDVYREQLAELWQEVKEHGLPAKTMRSAMRIARAQHKRDASKAVLDACVAVALSLLPPDEDAPKERPEIPDMTTGEGRTP